MPYIDPLRRDDLDPAAHMIYRAKTSGELTFQLTQMVLLYLGDEPNFAAYADAIAALECSKLELYRRSVAKHEKQAIRRNGDLEYPGRG